MNIWASLHSNPPANEKEVRAEVLWSNKYISLSPHLFPEGTRRAWIGAGILQVHDICHPTENRLLGHTELQQRFGVQCSFLQALSLRASVPFSWKSLLSQDYRGRTRFQYQMKIQHTTFDILDSSPKMWYRERLNELRPPFARKDSWSRDLENNLLLREENWEDIFTLPFKTS